MSFQQHLALLSLLLKHDHDAAADCLRRGAVCPDDFTRFVEQQQLQLSVFYLLDGSPIRQWLPRDWLEQLKRFTLTRWVAQETLVHELAQLSTLLAAAGQEFILLKGPYLAERFFGGIERREFRDLDILVRSEDLAAIEPLLRSRGYARKSNIFLNQSLTRHFTHAFDFAKSNVRLDLHWLLSANAAHAVDYEAVWREHQAFVLGNQRFLVLSDEYEVVFSLISIFKDLELGRARLRQFVDLYFILSSLNRRLDWEAFLEHRERERILRISVNVLALFLEFFDCRDSFPEVSTALARKQGLVEVVPSKYRQMLIEASPGALTNKLWAAGLYECSRVHLFLWWLTSLPFRLAVHEPDKYGRFERALQRAKGLFKSAA